MDTKNALLIMGIGTAVYLLLPRLTSAASTSNASTSDASLAGEVQKTDITLYPIPGAEWSLPIYVTMERDINFGWIDVLVSGIGTGLSTAATTVGNALSTAFTWGSNVLSGTVLPAITNIGGKTAEVLTSAPGWLWEGAKTVGGTTYDALKYVGTSVGKGAAWAGKGLWKAAKWTGNKTWDFLTGANNPAVQAGKEASLLEEGLKTAVQLGATALAGKTANVSNVSNNPQNLTRQNQGPATQYQAQNTKRMMVGYASKTNFTGSIQLVKMWNPQFKDTLVMTEPEGIDVATRAGYQVMDKLGYAATVPFENSVPLIRVFNPHVVDHMITTNINARDELAKIGYISQGAIGFIKAVQ